jgi:hypothetical protein
VSTPTPVVDPVQAFFNSFFATFKLDELKVFAPALAAFFTSLATNPTAANLMLAFSKLQVDILAAQPNLGQSLLQQLAAAMNALAQQVVATPAAAK